jgi:hypothetical protein
MFHLCLNNIDCDILSQREIRFKNSFKPYQNNQCLWCLEQTWFDKTNTIHTPMSKS